MLTLYLFRCSWIYCTTFLYIIYQRVSTTWFSVIWISEKVGARMSTLLIWVTSIMYTWFGIIPYTYHFIKLRIVKWKNILKYFPSYATGRHICVKKFGVMTNVLISFNHHEPSRQVDLVLNIHSFIIRLSTIDVLRKNYILTTSTRVCPHLHVQ